MFDIPKMDVQHWQAWPGWEAGARRQSCQPLFLVLGKDPSLRIKRLEEFLKHYIPLEEGLKITTEYEDGSSIYAVTGSAWVLARAYVEAGQKDKALKMIDWLQENDSKSDLFPKKAKSEQGGAPNP